MMANWEYDDPAVSAAPVREERILPGPKDIWKGWDETEWLVIHGGSAIPRSAFGPESGCRCGQKIFDVVWRGDIGVNVVCFACMNEKWKVTDRSTLHFLARIDMRTGKFI